VFYSDTDSVFLEHPIDNKYISKKIGDFKLECKIKKGVFISAKTYGIIDSNNKSKIKVKGFDSNDITFNE
jgi:DNA polymerase elongation subunit (family B)